MTVSSSTYSSPSLLESKSPISTTSPVTRTIQSLSSIPALNLNGLNTTDRRKRNIRAVLTTTQSSTNALSSPVAVTSPDAKLSMVEQTTLAETSFAKAVLETIDEPRKKSKISVEIKPEEIVGNVSKAKPKKEKAVKITKRKFRWNEQAIRDIIRANPQEKGTVRQRWIEIIKNKYNKLTNEERTWVGVDQKVRDIFNKMRAQRDSNNSAATVKKPSLSKKIQASEVKKTDTDLLLSSALKHAHLKKKATPFARPKQPAESIGLDLDILKKLIECDAWNVCDETQSEWFSRIVGNYNKATKVLSYKQIVPYIKDIVWPPRPDSPAGLPDALDATLHIPEPFNATSNFNASSCSLGKFENPKFSAADLQVDASVPTTNPNDFEDLPPFAPFV